MQVIPAFQVVIVGADAGVGAREQRRFRPAGQLQAESPNNVAGNLLLDREDVLHGPVEGFRPEIDAGCDIDQLRAHAQTRAGDAHTSRKHVGHLQLPAHLLHVLLDTAQPRRGVPGDYAHSPEPGERVDQLLGQAVAEVVVLRAGAEVGKRKHCNRMDIWA